MRILLAADRVEPGDVVRCPNTGAWRRIADSVASGSGYLTLRYEPEADGASSVLGLVARFDRMLVVETGQRCPVGEGRRLSTVPTNRDAAADGA